MKTHVLPRERRDFNDTQSSNKKKEKKLKAQRDTLKALFFFLWGNEHDPQKWNKERELKNKSPKVKISKYYT